MVTLVRAVTGLPGYGNGGGDVNIRLWNALVNGHTLRWTRL